MKHLLFALTLLTLSLGLSACGNTIEGVGKDIAKMGESLQ